MAAHPRPPTGELAVDTDSPLPALSRDLRRCRSRARRLWKNYQTTDEQVEPAASAKAHQAWSETIDEALVIAEAISRQQPRSLSELAMQFEAIWWWIIEDDSVLDGSTRRWLGRFRRSLRRLAATR